MEKDRISKRKKDYIEIINRFAHHYSFLLTGISIGLHYCDVQLMMVNLEFFLNAHKCDCSAHLPFIESSKQDSRPNTEGTPHLSFTSSKTTFE